jgi:1,5-anhydro-D-fructose reductase (1,5-anhydro-D-mannitol-forming)
MDQRTLRYGIIGFGRFAERAIAPAIRNAKNSALVGIQKRSAEEARKRADVAGVPLAFSTAKELAEHPDIDAVFIVSANVGHCPETLVAAEAGKHVIVEKPMAMNAAEARKMIEACDRNDVRLMVGHMVRLSPAVRRVRQLIDAGRIGDVKSIRAEFIYDARLSHRTWLIDRAVAGGGPVFDVGVHCLDTIRYILDDEPVDVRAAVSPVPTEKSTEETASISLRFSRGVIGSILCSYTTPLRRAVLEVIGTAGIITLPDFTSSNALGRISLTKGKADRPVAATVEEVEVPNLYVTEVEMFTSWVLGGPAAEIDGVNGLMNQEVLDRALAVP